MDERACLTHAVWNLLWLASKWLERPVRVRVSKPWKEMRAFVTCAPVVEDQARSVVVEAAIETLDIDRVVDDLFRAGTK